MRFPLFALLAPIATSLILWLVTKSPYTLLFALMGPVMAIASYGDARFGERRRLRLEESASEAEQDEIFARSQRSSALRRREKRQAHPGPSGLTGLDPRARPPWNADLSAAGTLRLGLRLEGEAEHEIAPAWQGDVGFDLDPLIIDAAAGVVCVGNPTYSLSLARALWMQLAWNVSPATLARHPTGHNANALSTVGAWPVRLVVSDAHIPPAARYVIEILSHNEARLSDRDVSGQSHTSFIPDYATALEARAFAERLARTSEQIERSHPDAQLPRQCNLGDVIDHNMRHSNTPAPEAIGAGTSRDDVNAGQRISLRTPVGVNNQGIVDLDLVAHGPHAVVTGMTGTGKSEFLLSWILSAAESFSPEEFTVLIIDFKGGSGFSRVAGLPHCMGIVTDLDIRAAQRALLSLRAELRFRERALNDAAVADFRDLPKIVPLARLVIVVDEYRALLDTFPDLQPLFLDIAARGRALGIHLILGTQRATGVLADSILANCALRVVFRVNNVSDSTALLETDAARTLPEIPGRAVLKGAALGPMVVQVALSHRLDALRLAGHCKAWLETHPHWQPRRPWLPELASKISLPELQAIARQSGEKNADGPAGALILGLRDEPEDQQQSVAHYVPGRDGHLLVLGQQGSGKSTLLRLIASQTPQHVVFGADNVEDAWDGITGVQEGTLVLIDDVEALIAELTLEHKDVFLEALMRLLRTGPRREIFVVIASQSGSLLASSWMSLMKSTLALGESAGRGMWQEHALQLAHPEQTRGPREPTPTPPLMNWQAGQQYVVVTPRPRLRMTELAGTFRAGETLQLTDAGRLPPEPLRVSSAAMAQVFIGDVEDWQSQFTLLGRLRPQATFVFDDCSPAEVRAVRRSRDVLPYSSRGTAISLSPEGVASRVRLT